ncbi:MULTISPECIES: hypothetical protein [Streptomyces]|uniref:Uncharacterized protein n=1 Tax=Streptomyces bangladeshensis TaxID=295352 RepID=A0ABN3BNC2_9ACTN|nr:hypothetical protein [Streptomyces sp. FBKL.4005]MYU31193.1 hypothetical protein [Streptomyces sp. SID7810]OYP14357.1 hypothetical protein CFC35_07350 [Streptomyces sp. FBKL.4005]CUW32298.1 hypothetical protein TUE45_07047 [Streptomyces reticuli]
MPTCLVLGPEALFHEEVVRPVCEELQLSLIRADQLTEPGPLGEQLVRHLLEEDVVVADLTGGHPSVALGLGVRHAAGRSTVLLGQAGTVPAGLDALPALQFPPLPDGRAEARALLRAALAEELGLAAAPAPDEEGGEGGGAGHEVAEPPAALEESGPGLLELAVAAETEMEAMAEDVALVEAAFQDLGAMGELFTEDVVRANLPGAPMSTRLAVVNRFAKSIEGPSDELEAAAWRLAARMELTLGALRAFLEWVRDTPRSEWPDFVEAQLDQVIEQTREVRVAATCLEEFGPMLVFIGRTSSRLRGPSRKIAGSLRTLLGVLSPLEECARMARALQEA